MTKLATPSTKTANDSAFDSFVKMCHLELLDGTSDETSGAVDYLKSRHLSKASVELHKIGYCPRSAYVPDEVSTYGSELRGKDWNLSGFIKGRLVVPVMDEFGKIVGIATRTPSFEKGNTWWNSPKPFYKGNHLFMLNKARTSTFKNNKIYIVEGYMDAFLLYQAGLKNVVGLMGTALTLRKISLVRRYCNDICLCFDVDENDSGQKAKAKSMALLKSFEMDGNISVISDLPVGSDPADFIAKNNLDALLDMELLLSDKDIADIIYNYEKKYVK